MYTFSACSNGMLFTGDHIMQGFHGGHLARTATCGRTWNRCGACSAGYAGCLAPRSTDTDTQPHAEVERLINTGCGVKKVRQAYCLRVRVRH